MCYFNRCILLWLALWGSAAVGGENSLPPTVRAKIENQINVQNILRARADIYRMNAADDAWACEVIRDGFLALGFEPSDPIFDVYVTKNALPRKTVEAEKGADSSDYLLRALDSLRSDSSASAIDRAEEFVKRSTSRVSMQKQRAYAALGGISAQKSAVDTLARWSEISSEVSAELRIARNVPCGPEDGDTPELPESAVFAVVGGCVSVSKVVPEARILEMVLPSEVRSRRAFPCVAEPDFVVGYHLISQTNILLT